MAHRDRDIRTVIAPAKGRTGPWILAFVVVAVALPVVVYFAWGRRDARPNLILITIDTLRADRVGVYGARDVETPALDRLASEGVRFEAAYVTVPLTLPSHVSMLTGQLPVSHSVRGNDALRVPEQAPLVASMLQAAGYETAAFVSSAVLSRASGLDRGFDVYDDRVDATGERPAVAVAAEVVKWLATERDKPFFLWVHFYDAHLPYAPPEPYRTRYAQRPYDGEVAYVDSAIQTILDDLRRQGLLDDTAVIAASDHGEALGEHGESSHGALLYEATIRVPLILRLPGRPGSRGVVAHEVTSARIAATLLDLAGLPRSAGMPDTLWSRSGGFPADDAESAISETLYLRSLLGWSPLYSVREGRFKLIEAPRPELYDLVDDPAETADLSGLRPDVTKRLRERLSGELALAARSALAPVRSTTTAARLDQLAALGYVSGGGVPARPFEPVGGANPRDRIRLWEEAERGLERSLRGDQAGAAEVFELVLRQDPDNLLALKFLGARALEVGNLTRAVEFNSRVAASGLHRPDALSNLSVALRRLGRLPDALAAATTAVQEAPEHSAARYNLALVLSDMGNRDEALKAITQVLARNPQHAAAQALRGELLGGAPPQGYDRALDLAGVGDMAGAIRELNSALGRRPNEARLHDLRGLLLARSGDRMGAIASFERALVVGSPTPDTLERLGALLHEQGNRRAARARFEQALAVDPSRTGARLSLSILDLEEESPRRAIERLETLPVDWPGAAQADFYLAEAKRAIGDLEGAREAYRACVRRLPPDDPIRATALRRLADLEKQGAHRDGGDRP